MPRIGPQRRAARREQFLIAAREIARERGYRGITVDEVCTGAGLSKGAFYVHFDSKQALLAAILEAEMAEVELLLTGLAEAETTYPERIREFLRAMVVRGSDPAEASLRAELWSQIAADPELRARMAEAVAYRRQRVAAFAWMAGHEGQMTPIPANAFGSILVALVDGLLLHSSLDPDGFRWENIRRAVDVVLDGLALEPPAG
ncbi:MAG: TetR/AcrR family transcriptional regulator [Sporichthyaceae bacterium]